MGASSQSRKNRGSGWLSSLLGASFLIVGGFLLGLVVGIVKEEPDLVISHLAGQGEEVHWSEQDPGIVGEEEVVYESETANDILPIEVAAVAVDPPPVAERVEEMPHVSAPARDFFDPQGFSIQVGAFAEGSTANRVAIDLRDKGYPVYTVEPDSSDAKGRFRVRVGPFPTKDEAQGIATRLKVEEKLPTWVLSEGGG